MAGRAGERGLRIAVWVADVADREGPEQSFLDEVRTFHVAPTFRSIDDLTRQVDSRLRRIASEELAPWCKLGPMVFRAHHIVRRRDEIRVEAIIRGDAVAHALDQMQPDKWGRGSQVQTSWAGKSTFVRVADLEVTTTAARSRSYVVTLSPEEPDRDTLLDVTFRDYGPDDLTEIALRVALFGERSPLKSRGFEFAAEMPDPLQPLVQRRVSEEIVRPVSLLLLTEALVGTGRAERITQFRLGPAVTGRRRFELQWQPPRRHSKDRPAIKTIDGAVTLP